MQARKIQPDLSEKKHKMGNISGARVKVSTRGYKVKDKLNLGVSTIFIHLSPVLSFWVKFNSINKK